MIYSVQSLQRKAYKLYLVGKKKLKNLADIKSVLKPTVSHKRCYRVMFVQLFDSKRQYRNPYNALIESAVQILYSGKRTCSCTRTRKVVSQSQLFTLLTLDLK